MRKAPGQPPKPVSPLLQKAWKYCAYQDRSSAQVRQKLQDWGASPAEIREIIENLIAEKFLDDERYLRSYIRGHFRHKQWGRTRIRYGLAAQQVDGRLADRLMDEEISSEAYEKTLQALYAQKARSVPTPDSPDEAHKNRQKIARFLLQRGFEWPLIAPLVFGSHPAAMPEAIDFEEE